VKNEQQKQRERGKKRKKEIRKIGEKKGNE